MNNIIFIKKVDNYDDIFKKKHNKIPEFIKKIVFKYKNFFNILTIKEVDGDYIYVFPVKNKDSANKIKKIFKKIEFHKTKVCIIAENFKNDSLYKIMDDYNIHYLNGEKLKKILLIKVLEYIMILQNEKMNNIELTILANYATEENKYLIEILSKIVKNIKVVSTNIYQYKKFEEKLYNEYGIAIQLSNSQQKSLAKSKIIINLDFLPNDINEYILYRNAIIINCISDKLSIKSKLFNGIVIHNYRIKFKKELKYVFQKLNLYDQYNHFLLYESKIFQENSIYRQLEKIEEDKVTILNLVGNNGIINKNEFKKILVA